jgi:hypothetical protein
MPDGWYPRCADCRREFDAQDCFRVTPPHGRQEGGGQTFHLCQPCWDRMIGRAVMSAMRAL